jgi:hypothetical protein
MKEKKEVFFYVFFLYKIGRQFFAFVCEEETAEHVRGDGAGGNLWGGPVGRRHRASRGDVAGPMLCQKV